MQRSALLSCSEPTHATVGHDVVIEDYAFVGAAATIGGFAVLDEGAILGMGAVIAPKRRVGAWSTVMVNSAVIADVPSRVACGGVPAVVFGPAECTKVA